MNGLAQGEQKLAGPMKVFGVLLIVTSIIEYGVGGAAYEFLSAVHVGGWWAGIVTVITAVFALMSHNRCVIIFGCIFAVIAIILAVIAAIIDGAQAGTISGLTGCIDPKTGKTWGSSSGISNSQVCYFSSDDAFDYYGGRTSQCICSDKFGQCYGYTLMSGSDCNNLFTTYYDELCVSCAFCVLLALLSFVYSILTCVNCCSPDNAIQAPPTVTDAMAPANVVAGGVMYAPAPVSVQSVQYIQPVGGPQVVYSQGYAPGPQGQVYYQPAPQQPPPVQYVYQTGGGGAAASAPPPMTVLEAQPVTYEPQQTKWT